MERKIGEIFEFDDEWYQCVEGNFCTDCAFAKEPCNNSPLFEATGSCSYYRNDGASVIFKKLKKVGDPHFIEDEIFEGGKVYVQNFKVYKDFEGHKPICNDYIIYDWKNRIISIEIKQKENMKEKKIQHYDCFFDEKSSKSKLKPFDLKAAKAGKPVCTRDGRKARIICFDAEGEHPIIALVTGGAQESPYNYTKEGYYYTEGVETMADLMMLPEKRNGWVNVYNSLGVITFSHSPYDTKEEALASEMEAPILKKYYVDTVKVEWEE